MEQPIVIHPELTGDLDVAVPESALTRSAARGPIVVTTDVTEQPSTGGDTLPVPVAPAGAPPRAHALDALRGLFLVSMTMGFTIWSEHLPAWMYHRQFPPPGDTAVDIAGISWRDLAYASFLFTMAAALPLTLARRIDKGDTEISVVIASLRRYGMLLLFALLIGHANTFFTGYNATARVLSVAGFGIMALVFTRRRADWNERTYRVLHRIGWVLAVAFLAVSPLAYGKTFAFDRIDDVIAGLAFASLAGSLIWYFTRDNLDARLGILAIAVALYLGAKNDGWIQQWWFGSAAPWAFEPSRFSLLTVVIPGTIVGDIILRRLRAADITTDEGWGRARTALVAVLATLFTPIVVVGLYNRQLELTTQAVLALVVAGLWLTWKPVRPAERMLRSLWMWGSLWMLIGLFLEPSEGGIKKAPETLSYFFTVTGTTTMLLVALSALTDALGRPRAVRALIDVGHNPLLMYVVYTVLLNPLLELTTFGERFLRESPALSLVRGAMEVMLVVVIVRAVSRQKIYWRT